MATSLIQAAIDRLSATSLSRVGRLGYDVVAQVGATTLIGLPRVEAVYLTGSATSRAGLVVGQSDIDLHVVARSESPAAELETISMLRRWQWIANVGPPFFRELDFTTAQELGAMLTYPNHWAWQVWRQGRWLRGTDVRDRLEEPRHRAPQGERLLALFRMWRRVCNELLRATGTERPEKTARKARVFLARTLAARLDLDDYTPLSTLLDIGQPLCRGPSTTRVFAAGDRARARLPLSVVLAAGLEVLEDLAARATAGWKSVAVDSVEPAPCAPVSAEAQLTASRASTAGFPCVLRVPVMPGAVDQRVIAIADASWGASEVVERIAAALGDGPEFQPEARPLFLTPPLWRALALFPPAPFVALAAMHPDALLSGRQPAEPAWPPPRELELLLRTRAAENFAKVRGRLLRVTNRPQLARRRFSREVRLLVPALDSMLSAEPVDPWRTAPWRGFSLAEDLAFMHGRFRRLCDRLLTEPPRERVMEGLTR